jgi:hypothetical protein
VALTNAGGPFQYSYDSFIAKYDRDGHLLWAKPSDVLGYDGSYRVAIDPAGNCFVAGYINPTAEFNRDNAFIAKLETSVPPPLTISPGTNEIFLSWSLLAENFYLESTDVLNQLANWFSNTVAPMTIDLFSVVTLPVSSDQRFYRLQRP